MRNVILGLLSLLIVLLAVLYREEGRRADSAERELSSLRATVLQLRSEGISLREEAESAVSQLESFQEEAALPAAEPSSPAVQEAPVAPRDLRDGSDPMGVGKVTSKYAIEDFEKDLVLSAEEKEKINERVSERVARGESISGAAAKASLLEGIVDDARYQAYASAARQKEEAEAAARLAHGTSFLASTLDLSDAQRLQAKSLIESLNQELKPASDDVERQALAFRARLMKGNISQETLVEGHEQMDNSWKQFNEMKKQLLNERLKSILSEEQYNKLLAAQASTENFMQQAGGM